MAPVVEEWDAGHCQSVLLELNEQQLRGQFCDVTVIAEDIKFQAHKNFLAASSLFFKRALTQEPASPAPAQVLELPGICAGVFSDVLSFIYDSRLVVPSPAATRALGPAARRLGISRLQGLAMGTPEGVAGAWGPEAPRSPASPVDLTCSSRPAEASPSASSSLQCGLCGFGSAAALGLPDPLHRERRGLSCRHCGKSFVHVKRLQTHEVLCKDGRREATVQGKKGLLLRHRALEVTPEQEPLVKVVDGHLVYLCGVCQRSYMTLSSLKRHANVHSWRRKYPCRYCDKVFALAEYRTKHEVWHTGERRYQCIFCWETFVTYYNLKTHQKASHGINPALIASEKTPNGGYKPKLNALKLYRLLPMRAPKRPYKTYSQGLTATEPPAPPSFAAPSPEQASVIAYGRPATSVIVQHGAAAPVAASNGRVVAAPMKKQVLRDYIEAQRALAASPAPPATMTYVAKPASSESQAEPLCQITVRLGDEAVVKRRLTESEPGNAGDPPEPPRRQQHPCRDCGKSFSALRKLRKHQRGHEGTGGDTTVASPRVGRRPSLRFACSLCTKVCKTAAALSRHGKRHRDEASGGTNVTPAGLADDLGGDRAVPGDKTALGGTVWGEKAAPSDKTAPSGTICGDKTTPGGAILGDKAALEDKTAPGDTVWDEKVALGDKTTPPGEKVAPGDTIRGDKATRGDKAALGDTVSGDKAALGDKTAPGDAVWGDKDPPSAPFWGDRATRGDKTTPGDTVSGDKHPLGDQTAPVDSGLGDRSVRGDKAPAGDTITGDNSPPSAPVCGNKTALGDKRGLSDTVWGDKAPLGDKTTLSDTIRGDKATRDDKASLVDAVLGDKGPLGDTFRGDKSLRGDKTILSDTIRGDKPPLGDKTTLGDALRGGKTTLGDTFRGDKAAWGDKTTLGDALRGDKPPLGDKIGLGDTFRGDKATWGDKTTLGDTCLGDKTTLGDTFRGDKAAWGDKTTLGDALRGDKPPLGDKTILSDTFRGDKFLPGDPFRGAPPVSPGPQEQPLALLCRGAPPEVGGPQGRRGVSPPPPPCTPPAFPSPSALAVGHPESFPTAPQPPTAAPHNLGVPARGGERPPRKAGGGT